MPRRVLHLIDTGGPGGAETVFLEVATGLEPDLWDSVVAVPERGWLYDSLAARGVAPLLVPSRRRFDAGYLGRLVELARRRDVELIHAHLFTSAVYASVTGRLCGIPVVCTFHGKVDVRHDDAYRRVKFRILDRPRNHLVFVSHFLRRHFLSLGPLRRSRTRVVYNGIDPTRFESGRDTALREELGVKPEEILVGAVGNLRPAKAYDIFLRAAAILRLSSPAYRFVIVGEGGGALLAALVDLRRELGLENALAFAGFREDVGRVMRNLDVYVLSSSAEGFSLTTLQALASGVPVVATRCGGPEEILQDGVAGRLVEPGAPEALARAVEQVAFRSGDRARFAAAGLRLVRERFTLARMIASYGAVYEECLGSPSSREAAE